MAGKIQLIYVDPPFFSNAKYQSSVQITGRDGKKSPVLKVGAYEDTWGHDLQAYLEMLAVRFFIMRDLLADTAVIAGIALLDEVVNATVFDDLGRLDEAEIRSCSTARRTTINSARCRKSPTTGRESHTASRASRSSRMSTAGIPWST